MASKVEYLLSLVGINNQEIRDTWVYLGSATCNSNTRSYLKDMIYKVSCTEEHELNGALVYCIGSYTVTDDWPKIEWDDYDSAGIEGIIGNFQGVESPFFKVLLLKEDVDALDDIEVNEDLVLWGGTTGNESESGVIIDDKELKMILSEVGVPFLRVDELELSADALKEYSIRPALEQYFTFFPIIKDQNLGSMGYGADFKVAFPEGAYACVPYYVLGYGGGTSGSSNLSVFGFYGEQMMYGGGFGSSGNFGRGIYYRKAVPGFTGSYSGSINAWMDGLAAAQGLTNLFRREHYRTIVENGKKYAVGYTTVGGNLNIKWLCSSLNFEDVKFSLRTDFRNLAKAYVLRNLGMLRALVKSDVPGTIDYSMYNSRADDLYNKVVDKWEKSATNLNLAIMRGGL